jgi:hemolysin activation/secretion protein
LLCVLAISAIANAQQVSPSVDPGVVRKQFEPPPSPLSELEATVEDSREPTLEPPESDVSFTLHDLSLPELSVYPKGEFDGLWQRYVGTEISLRELSVIAAAITVRYRNDGYVLSRALVPAQDITDGKVYIQVLEGVIDEVVIEGDVDRPGLWRDHAERLKRSTPLRASDLERTVLLLNDLPGASTRAILSASDNGLGASKLTLVPSPSAFSIYLDSNNRGTRFLGPSQGEFGFSAYSMFGLYESTTVRVNQTYNEDLSLFALDHSEVLCACGTRVVLSGSYLTTEPGSVLSDFDVDGESYSGAVAVLHPFIRSRGMNLTTFGRFDFLNSKNDIAKLSLSNDKVRALRAGVTFDATDRYQGVNLALLELSQGLPIFDASESDSSSASRPGAGGTFTRLYGRAQRLQRVGPGLNLFVRAAGQYAFHRLLAPEQFSFGGDDFGRGYDAAELIGDHGISTLAEIQWGRTLGYPVLEGLQLFTSFDYGVIWRRDGGQPGGHHSSAASFAFGTRMNLTSWLAARVTASLPLTRSPTIDRDDGKKRMRFFYGLTARY